MAKDGNEIERAIEYNEMARSISIKDAIEEDILLKLEIPPKQKEYLISQIIKNYCSCYNVTRNLTDLQIVQYASIVLSNRYTLSLQDIVLAFEYAKQGRYKKSNGDNLIFDRIDFDTLNSIFVCYEEERCEELAKKRKFEHIKTEVELNDLESEKITLEFKNIKDAIEVVNKMWKDNYKKRALSTYDLARQVRLHKSKKIELKDWRSNKINAYYEHFERIAMINIDIETKKQLFKTKLENGLTESKAKVECRRDALFELFEKLFVGDCESIIQMNFDNWLNNNL